MKLTPKQLFDAVKVLWPSVTRVVRQDSSALGSSNSAGWAAVYSDGSVAASHDGYVMDWNGQTEYPPTPEEVWRAVELSDIGPAFPEVRYRHQPDSVWQVGVLAGVMQNDVHGRQWVVQSTPADDLSSHVKDCQVRDSSRIRDVARPSDVGQAWRDAVPTDVGPACPDVRVRSRDSQDWQYGILVGVTWTPDCHYEWKAKSSCGTCFYYRQCQVKDY